MKKILFTMVFIITIVSVCISCTSKGNDTDSNTSNEVRNSTANLPIIDPADTFKGDISIKETSVESFWEAFYSEDIDSDINYEDILNKSIELFDWEVFDILYDKYDEGSWNFEIRFGGERVEAYTKISYAQNLDFEAYLSPVLKKYTLVDEENKIYSYYDGENYTYYCFINDKMVNRTKTRDGFDSLGEAYIKYIRNIKEIADQEEALRTS